MDLLTYSHRGAEILFRHDPRYCALFDAVTAALCGIGGQDMIEAFDAVGRQNIKSLSQPVHELIKVRLTELGRSAESPIFNDPECSSAKGRLDFTKEEISIEVAFDHGQAIAWDLLKPALASEMNHAEKQLVPQP